NANDIGPEGNIEKNVSLSVSNLAKTDFEAITLDAFSGGTKKDIKIVAAIDKTNASKQAKDEIQSKISKEITQELSEGEVLLDNAWIISKSIEKFDKATGDESDKLSVELSQTISAYVIKKTDVEDIVSKISSSSVPDGYELQGEKSTTETQFNSIAKDGVISLTATTRTLIIPKINTDEIANSIIGKKEDIATETIKSNSKVFDVSYEYTTSLPSAFSTLPHVKKNITVKRGVR
ncbi:MAG: hypothetical protein M3P33_02805, partial [bacterium]|nr:hypothetical protein [bacterium]